MSNGLRALPRNGAAADTRIVHPQGNMVLLRDVTPASVIEVVDLNGKSLEQNKAPMLMKVERLSGDYERPINFAEGDMVLVTNIGVPCGAFGLDSRLYLVHASTIHATVKDP